MPRKDQQAAVAKMLKGAIAQNITLLRTITYKKQGVKNEQDVNGGAEKS